MCTAEGGHIPNTRPCLVGTPAKSAGKGVRFPLWSVDAGRVLNEKPTRPFRGGRCGCWCCTGVAPGAPTLGPSSEREAWHGGSSPLPACERKPCQEAGVWPMRVCTAMSIGKVLA